jgi:hypothetical protein
METTEEFAPRDYGHIYPLASGVSIKLNTEEDTGEAHTAKQNSQGEDL